MKKVLSFIKENWLIIGLFLLGLFVRTYRQDQLLQFYYDQGRDAKISYDILTGANFPAIGPTTGIQGLFLGPLWFYLITPGYFLSQGNPALASMFIAFIECLTIPLIYFLVSRNFNKYSAFLASFLWTGSNYLVRSSRWFSNPSPLPFFVVLLMYLLTEIFKNKKQHYWIPVAFILGITLQLEAASAVFFVPIILVLIILDLKNTLKTKLSIWLKSLAAFTLLLLPQVAFEIKNNFLITKNFFAFLTGKINSNTGQTWAIPQPHFLQNRLVAYYHSFFSKLDTNVTNWSLFFLAVFLLGLFYFYAKKRQVILGRVLLVWLFVPLILLLFFVGNYGNLYDYYLTGFFPAFIILFALVISLPTRPANLVLSLLAIIYFINGNYLHLRNYLSAGVDGPTHITLGNEMLSVNKVCSLTKNSPYNLAIYVPPVVPHSYDYLFAWQSRLGLCHPSQADPVEDLFLIYEVDTEIPARLTSWYQGFEGLPLVDKFQYGGVTVERRHHLKK